MSAFNLSEWFRARMTPGSLAARVRRMRQSGLTYEEADKRFKQYWYAESLLENDGLVARASSELGVHRANLSTVLVAWGIDWRVIRQWKRELDSGNVPLEQKR